MMGVQPISDGLHNFGGASRLGHEARLAAALLDGVASPDIAQEDGLVIRVGLVLVAVRGRSGRLWEVDREVHEGMWVLRPLGDDVRPATVGNRMNGGVRVIWRTTGELRDAQRWREHEVFPAPREDACAYGCCRAGDVGLYSEVVRSFVG